MPSTEQLPEKIGSYQILRELGRGGMGVVYRAEDASGEPVAIKMMLPGFHDSARHHERFQREARAMERVVSEHTVRILDIGEHEGKPYFAMEYLRGQSLEQYLASGKELTVNHILKIGLDIGQGLADAHHQGVFHRDLKPDNIRLVSPNGLAKIIDFGLAREMDAATMTHAGP